MSRLQRTAREPPASTAAFIKPQKEEQMAFRNPVTLPPEIILLIVSFLPAKADWTQSWRYFQVIPQGCQDQEYWQERWESIFTLSRTSRWLRDVLFSESCEVIEVVRYDSWSVWPERPAPEEAEAHDQDLAVHLLNMMDLITVQNPMRASCVR
jgi:hypothetical protein